MTCVRSNACSDPALTKRKEALRFADKSELCWTLQTAHVILDQDLSDWKTGNSRQLKLFVRNEIDRAGWCTAISHARRHQDTSLMAVN